MKYLTWLSFGGAWLAYVAYRWYGAAEYLEASVLCAGAFALAWYVQELEL